MSRSSGAKPGFDGNTHGHREQLLVEARGTKFAAVRGGGKSTKKPVREYQKPNFYSTA